MGNEKFESSCTEVGYKQLVPAMLLTTGVGCSTTMWMCMPRSYATVRYEVATGSMQVAQIYESITVATAMLSRRVLVNSLSIQ